MISGFALVFSLAFTVSAQPADTLRCTLLYEIAVRAERIEMDRIGQIYAFAGNNWLKYDAANGAAVGRFSEYAAAADDVFDVSDPQKVVFFQPALQKGVVLDRTMNTEFSFNFNSNFDLNSNTDTKTSTTTNRNQIGRASCRERV